MAFVGERRRLEISERLAEQPVQVEARRGKLRIELRDDALNRGVIGPAEAHEANLVSANEREPLFVVEFLPIQFRQRVEDLRAHRFVERRIAGLAVLRVDARRAREREQRFDLAARNFFPSSARSAHVAGG